jgi:hypothetical protein
MPPPNPHHTTVVHSVLMFGLWGASLLLFHKSPDLIGRGSHADLFLAPVAINLLFLSPMLSLKRRNTTVDGRASELLSSTYCSHLS